MLPFIDTLVKLPTLVMFGWPAVVKTPVIRLALIRLAETNPLEPTILALAVK
jgi:hypothetical protein